MTELEALEKAYQKALEALQKMESGDHDCGECKYHANEPYMMPCAICERNYHDQWTNRKDTGEWIHEFSDKWLCGEAYVCSACGYGYATSSYFEPDGWEFCPHCGTPMLNGGA